ncbi:hypothetical protein D5086_001850 [Populus alba]|uniref:Uncharacterized protein n=1 Tax=Populus alba TaxID=43335 RepID=A0ACC4D1F4_POPAL
MHCLMLQKTIGGFLSISMRNQFYHVPLEAINTTHENIKALYDIRKELRACMQILLKDNGILVIPTIADPPSKLNSKKRDTVESHNRALILSKALQACSGCSGQVTIPLGKNDGCPISVSFITFHGGDKFSLDTVLDMYSSLKEQINFGFPIQHIARRQ